MKRGTIYVEYKYPNEPWREYDRSLDGGWAAIQYKRMQQDHPGAQYRTRKEA
jgi:hypothetical protein